MAFQSRVGGGDGGDDDDQYRLLGDGIHCSGQKIHMAVWIVDGQAIRIGSKG